MKKSSEKQTEGDGPNVMFVTDEDRTLVFLDGIHLEGAYATFYDHNTGEVEVADSNFSQTRKIHLKRQTHKLVRQIAPALSPRKNRSSILPSKIPEGRGAPCTIAIQRLRKAARQAIDTLPVDVNEILGSTVLVSNDHDCIAVTLADLESIAEEAISSLIIFSGKKLDMMRVPDLSAIFELRLYEIAADRLTHPKLAQG